MRTILVATLVVWAAVEVRQSMHTRSEGTAADRGSRPVIRVAGAVAIGGAILGRKAVPAAMITASDLVMWVGLAIVWCGIALRFWSFRTLGHYFTFTVQTSDDQPVIEAGQYRIIRHPSYAAILLITTGFGVVIDNWVSIAVLVVAVTVGVVYRIRVEEAALSRDLGGRYQAYAEGRKRLIPYLW